MCAPAAAKSVSEIDAASPALDHHLGAEGDELLHRFRSRANARFADRPFTQNGDPDACGHAAVSAR
jgi:hypothetical protein